MEGFCLPFFTPLLSFHYTDLVGCLLACQSYRQAVSSKHWSESLLTCCIMQYGGTTLTAFILGQPPGWMLSHASFLSLLIAWWLTFFSPFDIYWKFIHYPIVAPVVNIHHSFFLAISSIHAATSWGMDKVLYNTFHSPTKLIRESIFLSLLTAVLSSNGGGLIADVLCLCKQQSFQLQTPTCFQNNDHGDVVRSNLFRSFFLGVIYYIIMNPLQLFPWDSLTIEQRHYGHSIVGILIILMWLRSLFIPKVNLLGNLCSVLLRLLGISSTVPKKTAQGGQGTKNVSKKIN